MTYVSLSNTDLSERLSLQSARRVAASLAIVLRQIIGCKSLASGLDELPEHLLWDVGLVRNDVACLRKAPLIREGLTKLVRRFEERQSSNIW